MSPALPRFVRIRDAGPRDGFQNEPEEGHVASEQLGRPLGRRPLVAGTVDRQR